MPKWTDLTKIHEGCGGIIRWVEAIDQPGVGWTGECRACSRNRIDVESMLPVRGLSMEDAVEAPREELAELAWDDQHTWEHNQNRLRKEVENIVD